MKSLSKKQSNDIGVAFEDRNDRRNVHYPVYVTLKKGRRKQDGKKNLVALFQTHRIFDAVHYVVLLPKGSSGWNKSNIYKSKSNRRISVQEYYSIKFNRDLINLIVYSEHGVCLWNMYVDNVLRWNMKDLRIFRDQHFRVVCIV